MNLGFAYHFPASALKMAVLGRVIHNLVHPVGYVEVSYHARPCKRFARSEHGHFPHSGVSRHSERPCIAVGCVEPEYRVAKVERAISPHEYSLGISPPEEYCAQS